MQRVVWCEPWGGELCEHLCLNVGCVVSTPALVGLPSLDWGKCCSGGRDGRCGALDSSISSCGRVVWFEPDGGARECVAGTAVLQRLLAAGWCKHEPVRAASEVPSKDCPDICYC
eukprot:1407835-Amphidinium_carterae.5